ncbi:MAG: hypothetical protein NC917_06120 [Candidatus Omnitrophica bacterium]|nr:hypothetical protein [Candidatus Omnitrophota bacterium]MCM8809728.1 hypothetical protein [Candidatus Omnitrophota bacterium]MCM8811204.1 hypothetical protein [Candidatus Omnitrophota bacterium]
MGPFKNPPVFFLSPKSAFYSITWCASIIAHDAYHSKLYHDYREKYERPIPYNIYSGFETEKKVHCISLDGTHPDVNKDGKIDINDYNLMDW